jgi:hypothetical protein
MVLFLDILYCKKQDTPSHLALNSGIFFQGIVREKRWIASGSDVSVVSLQGRRMQRTARTDQPP